MRVSRSTKSRRSPSKDNLRVLTSGPLPLDPAAVLASGKMPQVVERLLRGNELVIFDGPPIQGASDAAVLSSVLDGTLLVIDTEHGDRAPAIQAAELLARADANVCGVVLYTRAREVLAAPSHIAGDASKSQAAGGIS